MVRNFHLVLISASILVLQACNLQIKEKEEDTNLALTITAMVAGQNEGSIVYITATPETASTVDASSTEEAVEFASVTVSTATNCRSGPGQNFEILYSLPPEVVAQVVGRNSSLNYWIIEIPNSNGKTCWLWGQYATVAGNTATISEVAAPTSAPAANLPNATATYTNTPLPLIIIPQPALVITKPTAPVLAVSGIQCTPGGNGKFFYRVNLTWEDKSFNEAGFQVLITRSAGNPLKYTTTNTSLIVELEEPAGTIWDMSLTAYNSAGHSAAVSEQFKCQ